MWGSSTNSFVPFQIYIVDNIVGHLRLHWTAPTRMELPLYYGCVPFATHNLVRWGLLYASLVNQVKDMEAESVMNGSHPWALLTSPVAHPDNIKITITWKRMPLPY